MIEQPMRGPSGRRDSKSSKAESDRRIDKAHRAHLERFLQQDGVRDPAELAEAIESEFMPIAEVRRTFATFFGDVKRLAAAVADPHADGANHALADYDLLWNENSNHCRDKHERLFIAVENIGVALGGRKTVASIEDEVDEVKATRAREKTEKRAAKKAVETLRSASVIEQVRQWEAQPPLERATRWMLDDYQSFAYRLSLEEKRELLSRIEHAISTDIPAQGAPAVPDNPRRDQQSQQRS